MKDRNYGIDLARIVAILLVLVFHVLQNGSGLTANKFGLAVGSYLESVSFSCVDLFALISGYVGVNGTPTFRKWGRLYLQVWFWSAFISLSMFLAGYKPSFLDLKHALEPMSTTAYWYFTAYTGLFVFMPLLNVGLRGMEHQSLKMLCVLMMVVFSVVSMFARTDIFDLHQGYSVVWLLILYCVGGVIRLNRMAYRNSIALMILLASTSLTFVQVYSCHLFPELVSQLAGYRIFASYTSPSVVLTACSLLVLCSTVSINGRARRVMAWLSSCSFGVYLIHVHPMVFGRLWRGGFKWLSKIDNPVIWVILLTSVVMLIYVCCAVLEYARQKLFALGERLLNRGVNKQ